MMRKRGQWVTLGGATVQAAAIVLWAYGRPAWEDDLRAALGLFALFLVTCLLLARQESSALPDLAALRPWRRCVERGAEVLGWAFAYGVVLFGAILALGFLCAMACMIVTGLFGISAYR